MTAEDKKIPAREALLLAAEKLFTEQGYAAVSTRELADEAHVNLGAIQYHFGSKESLFIETVRRLMQARKEANQTFVKELNISTPEEAATELCLFFYGFLRDVCKPCGAPNVCKLMYREVLDSTAQDSEMFQTLVSLVVDEFMRPVDDYLRIILKQLLPEAMQGEIDLTVHTIIGQCSFYITHRPFIEKLRETTLEQEETFIKVARHICRFTLRGLGIPEQKINLAIAKAEERKE